MRCTGLTFDDLDSPRSLAVHWCDAERSKIRMQELSVTISSSKIGNSGNKDRNRGLTRAGRGGKVVDLVNVVSGAREVEALPACLRHSAGRSH